MYVIKLSLKVIDFMFLINKKMTKNSLLVISFLFLVFSFISCDNENSSSQDNEYPEWQANEYFFRNDKILLNGIVSSDKYHIAGLFSLSTFNDDSIEPAIKGYPYSDHSITYKPAMNDHFVMYRANGSQFVLNASEYSWGDMGSSSYPFFHSFKLNELNTNYTENAKAVNLGYQNFFGAFNNQNQFLAFIDDPIGNVVGVNVSFCLIDLNPIEFPCASNFPCMELNPQLTYIPYSTTTSVFLRHINSYKDKFFAYVDGDFLLISSSGEIRSIPEVSGSVREIFSYQGKVYAVTLFPEQIFVSNDEGETWSLFADNFIYPTTRFFIIQEKVCFYIYSQLFHLNIETGEITELDNSGLDGHEITSVNEYTGRVWITSLTGLFYKDVNYFFTPKKQETEKQSPKIRITGNLNIIK